VLEALGPERACVLRTSWVYGPVGSNFCLTMLRLHRERSAAQEPLAVVADQVGCPTASHTLAAACWAAIGGGVGGVLHWSDAGAASWYDFAVAIGELAERGRLLSRAAAVSPITTADYPTAARRPAYSLLDCSGSRRRLGLTPVHWRAALLRVLEQVAAAQPAESLP
jgi:dTDP-4-dehydrorhamnose reductase